MSFLDIRGLTFRFQHTSLGGNVLSDPWANLSDKMGQAVNIYSRATPMNPAPPGIPDPELGSIVYLYTEAILRYGRLLFAVWSGKGWNPLSLSTMLSSTLPPSFSPDPPSLSTLFRLSSLTRITRTQISTVISQAHGPFLLHLQPSDRVQVLSSLAALYSCLGFRRREAFVLREVQAGVMDLIVLGREESRHAMSSSSQQRPDSQLDGASPTSITNTNGNSSALLSIRRIESKQGNTSVIRMARYVAQVYGVDLGQVAIADPGARRMSSMKGLGAMTPLTAGKDGDAQYGWPELQVGVVREALAIAEALPGTSTIVWGIVLMVRFDKTDLHRLSCLDHFAVAQFSLSTLRTLHQYVSAQEQHHLSSSATRAVSLARRRGLFHSMEFWLEKPLLSIELAP